MSPVSHATPASPDAGTKPRLLHLDWLRVLAMGCIFLFHNQRPYDFDDWHIKNAVLSQASTWYVEFFNLWMMPLFFVLSSAAIYYSLQTRTAGQFVRERFLRIAVPWLGLGMLVFGPVQVYVERLTHGDSADGFFAFLPRYFEGFYGLGGNFAWMGLHLWYLMMLFLFIIIMLPFLLPFGTARRSGLSRLSTFCRRAPVLVLMFVPLAAAAQLTNALGLGISREFGSWDIFSYLLFFTYGYLLHSDPMVQGTIDRLRWVTLALVAVATLLVGAMDPSGSWQWAAARAACAWSWILAILGWGHTLLNSSNRFVVHANEAVLPFYILHQPVIVVIAFFVVPTDAGVLAKYLLTASSSFVIIVALYEFVVRPVGMLRFLFGMRPKAAAAAARNGS